MCSALSTGFENPVEFVSVLNEMYSKKGLPTIDIPDHYLDASRNKYLQVNNITPPIQATPNIPAPNSPIPPSSTPPPYACIHLTTFSPDPPDPNSLF